MFNDTSSVAPLVSVGGLSPDVKKNKDGVYQYSHEEGNVTIRHTYKLTPINHYAAWKLSIKKQLLIAGKVKESNIYACHVTKLQYLFLKTCLENLHKEDNHSGYSLEVQNCNRLCILSGPYLEQEGINLSISQVRNIVNAMRRTVFKECNFWDVVTVTCWDKNEGPAYGFRVLRKPDIYVASDRRMNKSANLEAPMLLAIAPRRKPRGIRCILAQSLLLSRNVCQYEYQILFAGTNH